MTPAQCAAPARVLCRLRLWAPRPFHEAAQPLQSAAPGPEQLAAAHRNLNDKLTRQGRLPEVAAVLAWGQNQALAQPLRLRSKFQTVDVDQAEIIRHMKCNSKPTTFTVSPKNRKKDLAQHHGLAKVFVRTPHRFVSEPQRQKQTLQDEYFYSSRDMLYPGSLPPGLLVNSEEPPGPPKQSLKLNIQKPLKRSSPLLQQEVPAQLPQLPGEVEPSSTQQEAPALPSQSLEGVPSSTEQEAPVTIPLKSWSEAQHSHLPNVTVKPVGVELTVTPEPGKELTSSQEQAPAQPPEHPEDVGSSLTQLEALAQTPEHPEEMKPSATQQGTPAEPPGPPEKPSEFPGEVEPSETQQGAPAQPPESSMERAAQIPPNREMTVQPPGEDQAPYNLSNVTLRPADVEVTITSEPTKETEPSPAQQEAQTQPPEEAKTSATQGEAPTEPPGPLVEPELPPVSRSSQLRLLSFPGRFNLLRPSGRPQPSLQNIMK
ncbi:Leucine-rich repeat-containing protein 37B [Plecturocebus cupreus]